jgi:pimeloyl-ACP methyl ester carboxylesterase
MAIVPPMATIRHSTVSANGIRIHIAEQGEGPLVLLVHGFPELWYSWRHQIPALAEAGYRAVAIDQRGYGRSSKLWDPLEYRISRLVGDAVEIVYALGEKTAVIVGHDWGAPVAWTAAWTRPEVFRAVVGMSVPYAARALIALPGSPFGELRPSEVHRRIAGEGQDFYETYFATLGAVIQEIEADVRGWLRDAVFSFSGDAPLPPGLTAADLSRLDPVALIRGSAACVPHGARMRDRFATPNGPSSWFTEADLDVFTGEFERTGFAGGLSFYRAMDAGWEELAPFGDRPVTVPALFMGGECDAATLWGAEAIARAKERVPDLRGSVVLSGCGHWIQQERPTETNRILVDFLGALG